MYPGSIEAIVLYDSWFVSLFLWFSGDFADSIWSRVGFPYVLVECMLE